MQKPIVIDLFCGAGGESSGIMQAFREHDMLCEMYAINHWELALDTHAMNYPDAFHYPEDVFKGTAKKHIRDRRVSLLWASPSCTHFSRAKGGKPCNPQERASANSVLEWCRDLHIDRVVLENVEAFLTWGELDKNGIPIPERKGKLFKQWLRKLKRLGYDVAWMVLCAADVGAPTSRERLFVQAVRRDSGKRIMWPTLTHPKHMWVPASSIIDWSNPGTLLHERKRPLCDRTLDRIERGMRKYWGEWAEPYIVILRGQSTTRSVHDPLPTLTAGGGHLGLVCPIDNGSNKGGCRSTEETLSTIVVKQRHGLVTPMILGKHRTSPCRPAGDYPVPTLTTEPGPQILTPLVMGQHSCSRARAADQEPLSTITTAAHVHMATPLIVNYYGNGVTTPVDRPMPTATTKARFGLITPGDLALGYRMLDERELARGQSFPDDYKFAGTKTQIVKQIGNAVPPKLAYAQMLPYINEIKEQCLKS